MTQQHLTPKLGELATILAADFEGSDAVTLTAFSAAEHYRAEGTAKAEPGDIVISAPVAAAAHAGRFGAAVRFTRAFAKPSDAKLVLSKFTAVAGFVNVTFWIRAIQASAHDEAAAPAAVWPTPRRELGSAKGDGAHQSWKSELWKKQREVESAAVEAAREASSSPGVISIELLDESEGYKWIGAWQTYEVRKEWQRIEATILVGAKHSGHTLNLALVVGGLKRGFQIDDIFVGAPRVVGAGVPVRALLVDFEELDVASHVGIVYAAPQRASTPAVKLQLHSPIAAISGKAGAHIHVLSPVEARLVLCLLIAPALGALRVIFWGRGGEKQRPMPRLSVDVFDASESRYEWLGTSDELRLSTSWQRYEVQLQLGPARVGRKLEVGIQVGRVQGHIHLDDVEVWAPVSADGRPPRLLPPPLPSGGAELSAGESEVLSASGERDIAGGPAAAHDGLRWLR